MKRLAFNARDRGGIHVRAVLLIVFSAVFVASASANLFSPSRPLRVIKTKWFNITFPKDLEAQAKRLASFADDTYRELAEFFGTEPKLRYPVVLTPDSESVNGYYSVYPHRRIVLYVTPTDPNGQLGALSDDLASIFRHELAHAVSLSIRPTFWNVMTAIFGDPAGLSFFTTPASLAEGAAIAAESMDGQGRANDTLSRSEVAQDVLEGRFKTFWEAAGAWDQYPYGRVPYSYGALFTKYLRDRYGDDLYRDFWRRMGRGLLIPGLGDLGTIRGVFHQVYGISLSRAWGDFEAWISPGEPVLKAERITEESYITAVAASGATVYCADISARKIYAVNAETGERLRDYPGDASISRLDVSPDGKRMLVSYLRYKGNLPRLALRELDLRTGRSRRLKTERLRDAAYAAGGIAAVRAEPGAASLVLVRDGKERVLLSGAPAVSYASPCGSPDGRWIYALRREAGAVSVVRLAVPEIADTETELSCRTLELPETFRSIRYLSVDASGTLRFSWDDGSFYRLAEVNDDRCVYQTASVSGGVHQPVGTDIGVSYLGFFSEGVCLCVLDPGRTDLALEEEAVRWENPAETASGTAPSEAASAAGEAETFESHRYFGLPWLLPRFWYPSFTVSSGELWSVGAVAVSADPAERFSLAVQAEWIPELNVPTFDAVLELSGGATLITIEVFDTFKEYTSKILQSGYAGVSVERDYPFYDGRSLGIQTDLGVEMFGWGTQINPYGNHSDTIAVADAVVSYGRWAYDIKHPAASKGVEGCVLGFGALPNTIQRKYLVGIESALFLRALPAALALDLYGVYSLTPNLTYGPDGRTIRSYNSDGTSATTYYLNASYPDYTIFSEKDSGTFYAYADASAAPLVLEAQARFGPVHIQRFVLRTGARGAVSSGEFLYSGYSRLTCVFAPLLGVYAQYSPEVWVEAEYSSDNDWALRYTLELPL